MTGELAIDHDGVLHEHSVGAVVGRRNLDDLPALRPQRIDVPPPLAPCDLRLDRGPDRMRDQTLAQTGAGTTDERARYPARNSATAPPRVIELGTRGP